jgi:O-acetylhomoserine (thiol)-lyase
VAHEHGIPLVADNTFLTPYLFRPFEHGADIVIHSATKYIDGHGSSTGGVIVDGGRFDWEASGKFPRLTEPDPSYHNLNFAKTFGNGLAFITRARVCLLRDLGPCLSPFHSFLFIHGLETLSLRMERHADNALKAAQFLNYHENIETVTYPGLPSSPYYDLVKKYFPKGPGAVFSAVIKGGKEGAKTFIARLKLFSLVANLGDVRSLVIHPASTTHSQMSDAELVTAGISPGAVRFSIGTEHIDDIIEDLRQALTF